VSRSAEPRRRRCDKVLNRVEADCSQEVKSNGAKRSKIGTVTEAVFHSEPVSVSAETLLGVGIAGT
jgi:hypothetical protein